jgi:hypothetical protein
VLPHMCVCPGWMDSLGSNSSDLRISSGLLPVLTSEMTTCQWHGCCMRVCGPARMSHLPPSTSAGALLLKHSFACMPAAGPQPGCGGPPPDLGRSVQECSQGARCRPLSEWSHQPMRGHTLLNYRRQGYLSILCKWQAATHAHRCGRSV